MIAEKVENFCIKLEISEAKTIQSLQTFEQYISYLGFLEIAIKNAIFWKTASNNVEQIFYTSLVH